MSEESERAKQKVIADLAVDLADWVEDVCEYLLPSGRRLGERWVVDEGVGTPVSVQLRYREPGAGHLHKPGDWNEEMFCSSSSPKRGNLFDLWVKVRGITPSQAITEINVFLTKIRVGYLHAHLGPNHATIHNIGSDAGMTPTRMRRLAAALMQAADECEALVGPMDYYDCPRRKYLLTGEPL